VKRNDTPKTKERKTKVKKVVKKVVRRKTRAKSKKEE